MRDLGHYSGDSLVLGYLMRFDFRKRINASAYWRDILWQASGNGVAQVVGLLGLPLLTRLYTPQDFGVQNLFILAVGFASGLMTWRYEYFIQLPKDSSEAKCLLHLVFLLGIVTLFISTPVVWVFDDQLAVWLGNPELSTWLVFVPATALLVSYAVAVQHSVQRRGNYRRSGLSELAGKSAYIGCGATGGAAVSGPLGLIAAPAASAIGKIFFLLAIDKKWGKFRKIWVKGLYLDLPDYVGVLRLARRYERLAGSLVFSALLSTCTGAIPAIYIAHAYGGSVLGQFALVTSTIYLPAGLIGTAIGQVYYQRAAECHANNKSFFDLWSNTAKRLIGFGVPVYISVAVVSTWAYPFVFGGAWADAGKYGAWMAIAAFFSFISGPLDRTSLVVGVWWYLPIWHIARFITTGGVVFASWLYTWSFDGFLILLVVQIASMYLIDFFAERRFALQKQMDR